MSMEKEQAMEIIKKVVDVYTDQYLTQPMLAEWYDILTKKGDYRKTKIKLGKYIEVSKYTPKISEIMIASSEDKVFYNYDLPEEETKSYKLKNDEHFRNKFEQLKKEWENKKEAWESEDD